MQRAGEWPTPADRAAARLLRRRFDVALPPPFADAADPSDPAATPVRLAVPADGPAIAAVKWRAFGTCYRGVLPDAFLDRRDIVPPVGFWVGRAAVPPSSQQWLTVLGRPGHVLGYCDAGPCPDTDVDPSITGEVYELYLDPTVLRAGGGSRLLDDAVDHLSSSGLVVQRLWVLRANTGARSFYESRRWLPDGAVRTEDLGDITVDEVRYRRAALDGPRGGGGSGDS